MLTGLRDRVRSAVLMTAAIRMRDTLRGHDLIARLAGDEFPVLLFAPSTGQDLDRHIDQLHCAAAIPIHHSDTTPTVTASTGVALVDAVDDREAFELLQTADAAMYAAKATGPGQTGFAP